MFHLIRSSLKSGTKSKGNLPDEECDFGLLLSYFWGEHSRERDLVMHGFGQLTRGHHKNKLARCIQVYLQGKYYINDNGISHSF
mmetsp:Transcript_40041/g.65564  ORF Transcript_40041/g.65564 Transcript_40041/m.65564 type:complete len:84 (-) Transcript_40041:3-254(-)